MQEIRPELHRYCARMVGAVVAAKDVVQKALVKASAALPTTVATMRGRLFRIVPNQALDHLRRARPQPAAYLDAQALVTDSGPQLEKQERVARARSVFLQIAPQQRSCVENEGYNDPRV